MSHNEKGNAGRGGKGRSIVDNQLTAFKKTTLEEAERLIRVVFPNKVLELSSLLDSSTFRLENLYGDNTESAATVGFDKGHRNDTAVENSKPNGGKKRKIVSVTEQDGKQPDLPPLNSNLMHVIDIVRPHIVDLMEHAKTICLWIQFHIPKIEDGNNFGVEIQETTMAEAKGIEVQSTVLFEEICSYFLQRGTIIGQMSKYSSVVDFHKALAEFDKWQFFILRAGVTQVRNHYCNLHGILTKNMDKIKNPRSGNAVATMY